MTEITNETRNLFFTKKGTAVVVFYSPDCGHCKMLEKELEQMVTEIPDTAFGRVNIAAEAALTGAFDVQSVPTVLYIKNGEIRDRSVGFVPKEAIQGTLSKLNQI